jgi:hypothetical protein
MAPGALIDDQPTQAILAGKFKNDEAPRAIFPDGIRTSGQHPPLYDALRPYEDFPKEISGPTVWQKEEFENSPERWTHRFTKDELAELGATADRFIASGTPLTGISKVCFPFNDPITKGEGERNKEEKHKRLISSSSTANRTTSPSPTSASY